MYSSSEESFKFMLSMLVSSWRSTASSLPLVNIMLVNPARKSQVDWLGCAVETKGQWFSIVEVPVLAGESGSLTVLLFRVREFLGSSPCEAGP